MSTENLPKIAYLPYAHVAASHDIGKYEVWPYFTLSEEKIADKKSKELLDKLLSAFYERRYELDSGGQDNQLFNTVVISPKDTAVGSRSLMEKEIREIRLIRA